jgi:hypothetical protein
MRNHKDTPGQGGADRDVALLVQRVRWVWKRGREWIVKDGSSLVKVDAMLREVGGGFLWIPLKNHAGSLYPSSGSLGLPNTKISSEDRAVLAVAGVQTGLA